MILHHGSNCEFDVISLEKSKNRNQTTRFRFILKKRLQN